MHYNLSTERKPNTIIGYGARRVQTVAYDETNGFPNGIENLAISLRAGISSFNELVNIVISVPKTVTFVDLSGDALNGLLTDELVKIIEAIPAGVKRLNLCRSALRDRELSAVDLIRILKAVPRSAKYLELDGIELGRFSPDELINIFKAIDFVTHLDLSSNGLSSIVIDDLVSVLKELSISVTHLRLVNNAFERISADDLIRVILAIPETVISLDLRGLLFKESIAVEDRIKVLKALPQHFIHVDFNNYNDHYLVENVEENKSNELVQIFNILPPSITYLDVHDEGLSSALSLIKILRSIPHSIKILDLHYQFNAYSSEERQEILRSIPSGVKTLRVYTGRNNEMSSADDISQELGVIPESVLDLSVDCYDPAPDYFSTNDRVKILQSMPPSFKKLHLKWASSSLITDFPPEDVFDAFEERTISVNDVVTVLNAIPQSVLVLDLSEIGLFKFSTGGVILVLQAIPRPVTYLDLSTNGLFKLGIDGVIEVLQATPLGVTHLDLRGNLFHMEQGFDDFIGGDFSAADLIQILQSIPKHVSHIYFDQITIQTLRNQMFINSIFYDFDFYYDACNECCVRGAFKHPGFRSRLALGLGHLSGDVVSERMGPFLSFREVSKIALARITAPIKDPITPEVEEYSEVPVQKKARL